MHDERLSAVLRAGHVGGACTYSSLKNAHWFSGGRHGQKASGSFRRAGRLNENSSLLKVKQEGLTHSHFHPELSQAL